MAKGISIGVAADTREFDQAVKKGILDPLEKVDKGLGELGNSRDLDKLEDGFKAAQRPTDDLRKDIEKVKDALADAGRKGGKTFSDGIKDGARDAERELNVVGDGVKGFKEEAVANFSEVASSFDGSMSSAIGGVQGLLGGLAASLGPVGIALAGLGAVGGAFYNQWEAATEATKEAIQSMYDDMAESGQEYLSGELLRQNLLDVSNTKRDEIAQKAKDLGLDQQTVARAMAGYMEDLNLVIDTANKKYDEQINLVEKSKDVFDSSNTTAQIAAGNYAKLSGEFNGYITQQDTARDQVHLFRSALEGAQGAAKDVGTELDNLNSRSMVPKEVQVRANLSQAEKDLNSFLSKKRNEIEIGVRYASGKAVLQ